MWRGVTASASAAAPVRPVQEEFADTGFGGVVVDDGGLLGQDSEQG